LLSMLIFLVHRKEASMIHLLINSFSQNDTCLSHLIATKV
jgi:hypothetical protein